MSHFHLQKISTLWIVLYVKGDENDEYIHYIIRCLDLLGK